MKRKLLYGLSIALLLGLVTTGCNKPVEDRPFIPVEPEESTLAGITVSGQKTEYKVGDEFVKPTVTATYEDGTNKNVTSKATFEGFDSSSPAVNQTITVKYTERSVTKSATYNVTISENVIPAEAVLVSITVSNQKTEYEVGDTFVKPTVTASYSEGSPKVVTDQAVFTGFNSSRAVDSQTIKVEYTEKNVTKSVTYNISIKEKGGDTPPSPSTVLNLEIDRVNPYNETFFNVYYKGDNEPFTYGGNEFDHLNINGTAAQWIEYKNLEASKYFNIRVADPNEQKYDLSWINKSGKEYAKASFNNPNYNPGGGGEGGSGEEQGDTEVGMKFVEFYAEGSFAKFSYEKDPFNIAGHTYSYLKFNGTKLADTNDVINVPEGKYVNIHVSSDKLNEYKFEFVDDQSQIYYTYTYTPSSSGGESGGDVDPSFVDDLGDDHTPVAPKGTNVDNIVVSGIDNINWSKGRYFDVFDGVTATSNGKDITSYVQVNGNVNYGVPGNYNLEYVVEYGASNASFTRTVTITNDQISRDTVDHKQTAPTLPTGERGSIATGEVDIPHPINPNNIDNELKNRAVPTNTWYSGILAEGKGSVSNTGIFANQYRAMFNGNRIAISDVGQGGTQTFLHDKDSLTGEEISTFSNFSVDVDHLFVSTPNLNTGANINLIGYSDNSAKLAIRNNDSKVDEMVMSIAQGSPYIVFENNGGAFNLDFNYYGSVQGYKYYNLNGEEVHGPNFTGEALIVELQKVHRTFEFSMTGEGFGAAVHKNVYFLINTPKASTYVLSHKLHPDSTKLDSVKVTPKDANYVSVAPLGDDFQNVSNALNMIKRLHKHAYAMQDRANTSYTVNHETNVVETTFRSNIHRLDKDNVSDVLYTLQPHQYKKTDATVSSFYISSMRGKLRFSQGLAFKTRLDFRGLLPNLAVASTDGEFKTNMVNYLNSLDELTNYDGTYVKKDEAHPEGKDGKDDAMDVNEPYWNSKAIYPLSQGLMVAAQLGEDTLKQSFISKLRYVLEDWFKYDGESDDRFLYYNNTWGAVYTNNSDFGVNDRLTDHHFTFGYFVYASSVLSMYDSSFLDQYQSTIALLNNNYFNIDRNNTSFPYMRNFDSYNGHSWSDGFGNARDGNNQESTGEALNAYTGSYLFGLATNNQELVDASIYAFTTELYSVKQYWFDYDETNWYGYAIPKEAGIHALGMVWGGKNEHKTWFGPSPEFIYGIQWLPTGEYLTSYALGSEEQAMLTKIYQSMIARRGGEPLTWFSNMWSIEAMTRGNTVLSKFDASKILGDDYPNELVGAYLMIMGLNQFGLHSGADYMEIENQVACSVYDKNGVKTALVWNASGSSKTVKIHVGNQVVEKTVEPGFHSYSL